MDVQELLDNPPKAHIYGGQSIAWGLPPEVARFIAEHVGESSRTLETGVGVSTVLFAMLGATHTCIAPVFDEIERIRAYCGEQGVSLAKVDFQIDRSDVVLPRLPPDPLDLALIDGCHGFPVAFMDWYYVALRLKVGGIAVIDDTQLWTGRVLLDFARLEPEWELHDACRGCLDKAAIFVKRAEYVPWKEWNAQPYVEQRSTDLLAAGPAPPEPPRWRQIAHLVRRGHVRKLLRMAAGQEPR